MVRVGFPTSHLTERERLKRLHVRSNGQRACAEGHLLSGDNVLLFDVQRLCKVCVESGLIKPELKREVYFIADGIGHVKIGIASDVQARFTALQSANPHELSILASMPGNGALERSLHRRFSAHHVRGEWFRLTSEIEEYIANIPPKRSQSKSTPDYVRIQQELSRKQARL